MKHALTALMLALPLGLPLASAAQTPPAPAASGGAESDDNSFGQMLDDQIGSFFDGIMQDIGPKMEDIGKDLGARLSTLAPVFDELSTMVDDIKNYQTPERLANGDILIRRKPDAPPPPELSERFTAPRKPAMPGGPEITPAPAAPLADPAQPQIDL